ncbi:integrase, catalytic region, zinc finger, CCHC-type containing protein [Tanacetum coccineum]
MFSSSTGLFSFQFSSREGLNAMLENSPWFLRNSPLILKKWHPDLNLLKEDVGTPLMLDSYTSDICMKSWDRSSYARAMIELRADVELRDNIVAAMPKITGEGYYTCNIRVLYEWKPPRYVSCKVFGHTQKECPKNVVVLTPVIEKIDKIEKLIIKGKVTLVDDDGKPLKKVNSLCDYDSEDEVASIDNDMAKFLAKKDGYVTQSLLKQWTKSYENSDYGYDPYDDDMYEGQDIPELL